MDVEKSLKFIEDSFLAPLLEDANVTDISYNGESIYYLHNRKAFLKTTAA